MNTTVKKIWNLMTGVLVAAVVIFALALVGVRLLGYQVYTVLSGSMEPTFHVGSLIYVKRIDPKDLKAGDIITFMLDKDTVATHRIVKVVPDKEDPSVLRFETKGDANSAPDGELVHYKNVIGRAELSIPMLGYVANYVRRPPGLYVAVSGGALLLLFIFLPDILKALFEDEKKKKPPESGEEDRPEDADMNS